MFGVRKRMAGIHRGDRCRTWRAVDRRGGIAQGGIRVPRTSIPFWYT